MDGIADYRFVRPIGEGGHGAFYLAEPPPRLGITGDFVTVKILFGANNEENLRRATRELRAFASASSPFLVNLLDAGRQDDMFFYAMEHCALGSLRHPERALGRAEILRGVAQAARGAHALHEAGLVHRSISPANILLHSAGARLSDLGLVQTLQPTETMTGLGPVDAVEFMEPTLLSGGLATASTDIWSLAASLHWALAGVGIYGSMPGNDPLLAVRKVLTSHPVISDDVTGSEAELIAACLDPSADRRPASAQVLADALEAAA
ncbi:serine/threonine-protein kinase [Aeromicrobium sp. A1-2]|uniref:serine/threonine-protein kinase n=1 Tax=Aeromicrobium sp. A1-2 TaxID=2107713 RepID=UPI0013C2F902|nr:serine/threonine-protein kinase [Aeromicrobium sp. A1-2]